MLLTVDPSLQPPEFDVLKAEFRLPYRVMHEKKWGLKRYGSRGRQPSRSLVFGVAHLGLFVAVVGTPWAAHSEREC